MAEALAHQVADNDKSVAVLTANYANLSENMQRIEKNNKENNRKIFDEIGNMKTSIALIESNADSNHQEMLRKQDAHHKELLRAVSKQNKTEPKGTKEKSNRKIFTAKNVFYTAGIIIFIALIAGIMNGTIGSVSFDTPIGSGEIKSSAKIPN